MILTAENYYSSEADREYLSVSQYKSFCGSLAHSGCEAKAMSQLMENWIEEKSTPLLVGSYVDAYFEGTLDTFKSQNQEIFTAKGSLKSDYKQAEKIIQRAEADAYFMKFLSGQKQVIMTGEIAEAQWKIKMDSYLPGVLIADLKVMKSLSEHTYINGFGQVEFVRAWGYDIQGAVYQEIVRQNTGECLPFYIAALSKEKEPDIKVIYLDNELLSERLEEIKKHVPHIMDIKNGRIEPTRCEKCDYCKRTRKLTAPIHYLEL